MLRGSSLIDIGALYAYGGMSTAGITARMDQIATAGVQGHVVRMPVYPEINYNTGGDPTCSPLPYPVGSGPIAACTPTVSLSGPDYVSRVLKPAVDYASSKNLYVIIDFHQIDSIVTGNSAADAKTFWTAIAPVFAGYSNVLYEPFIRVPLVCAEADCAGLRRYHPRWRPEQRDHRAVADLGSIPRRRRQ